MYKSHGKEYIENNFSPAELAALMKSAPSPPATMIPTPPLSTPKAAPLSKKLNDKFQSQLEIQNHLNKVRAAKIPAAAKPKKPMRRPGPASKTNAPPEKRGSASLPTYLQLTQVSRRSSNVSEKAAKPQDTPNNPLSDIVLKLAEAAATKNVRSDEKQTCNFCPKVCKNQAELSLHLVNDHFKGLIPLPSAQQPVKRPASEAASEDSPVQKRAKQIRQNLGLDVSVYRRPGPKCAKLKIDSEGTLSDYKKRILPSSAVLSSSKLSMLASKFSRPVVLSSNSIQLSIKPQSENILRPPTHIVNMMLSTAGSTPPSGGSPQIETEAEMEENNNNNNNNSDAHANLMLNLMNKPRKKSECPVCGIILSPKTNVNVHLRTHSGVRPYECVLCLNRFRQKAHLMKHFRCTHNQKQPPHICLFCSLETATSNDLYRHITDAHQKETDELRPSLLAARSDAAAAAKEAQLEQNLKTEVKSEEISSQEPQEPVEEPRYEPITEDFMYEDMVIAPCYVVLPYVSDEEVEAAGNSPQVILRENIEKIH